MTISDILQHPVLPFEIEDVKLVKLFSFFLHSAPTIESATAISMEAARLDQNWMSFITSYPKESWLVIAPNCTFGAYMIKAGLDGNAVVSRRKKGFSYTINIQHLLSLVKLLNPRRIHRNVRL